MSGAPVIAYGCLLGVVTEHAPREGTGAITATPLTALEADPARTGWGPGVADPAAWWARLGVSGMAALRRLPTSERRPEPAYLETVREIRHRTSELIGRREELADITAFAHGSAGYRLLVAGAWAGKTSLLAEAAVAHADDVDVVSYFLSRRESDADSAGFLAAMVPQLGFLMDERSPKADRHEFRSLWRRAAERAADGGRHLLMIVDGLDEDLPTPTLASVAALLPAQLNESAHILISSRPYAELPADLPVGHPLLAAAPVTMRPYAGAQELSALARQEIDDLMRRDDDGLTAEVLGVLTAAAGPLALADLATMTLGTAGSAAGSRRIPQAARQFGRTKRGARRQGRGHPLSVRARIAPRLCGGASGPERSRVPTENPRVGADVARCPLAVGYRDSHRNAALSAGHLPVHADERSAPPVRPGQ